MGTKYRAEKLPQRTQKEEDLYELFRKMKRKNEQKTLFFYGVNFKKFVMQGQMLEKVTDEYEGKVWTEQINPFYDELSDDQLRTYFTWRTKVRKGLLQKTCRAFFFMHVYELINHIGVNNKEDGLEQLIVLWVGYRQFDPFIDKCLPIWVKDYYICNEFDVSFYDIIRKYGLEQYYPELVPNQEQITNVYELLSGISNYQFEESKFYTAKNELILADCFQKTIENLVPLLDVYGWTWEKMVKGVMQRQEWWVPFRSAIYVDTTVGEKSVSISARERYSFENGNWTSYRPANQSTTAGLIVGYIIKKIEANLRLFVGHRHKLNPKQDTLVASLQNVREFNLSVGALISDPLFHTIIDDTTTSCFAQEVELVSIREKWTDVWNKPPYPTLKKMRTAEQLEKTANPARRFYMQGQIVYELEDAYEAMVPFEEWIPTYDCMTNEQLRCYFTWRSKVRQGVFAPIPGSYLKLYVFELINQIGGEDKWDVIRKMADILLYDKEIGRSEEKVICNWLKDYYVCGNFDASFYEVIHRCQIEEYYPHVTLEFSDVIHFQVYEKMSSYKIKKSKFYVGDMVPMVEGCFSRVVHDVDGYFRENQEDLKKILIGKGKSTNWWRPFHQAICCQPRMSEANCVRLSNTEVYYNKNGLWDSMTVPEKNTVGTYLIGYMMKRMEQDLRKYTAYKYKISADISTVVTKLTRREAHLETILLDPAFDQRIDEGVLGYLKENYPEVLQKPKSAEEPYTEPVKLHLDFSKFEKIREEAEQTREKLTTEEWEDEQTAMANKTMKPFVEDPGAEIKESNLPEEDPGSEIKEFNLPEEDPGVGIEKSNLSEEDENPWQLLYGKWTDLQRKVVEMMVSEADTLATLQQLSQQNQVLPEVIFEGINEMALECIGDTMMETVEGIPVVYEEYAEKVKGLFGRN